MKYKAVIFDLDGTLMDSLTDLAIAGNYSLEKCGMPVHSHDKYKYFVGNGIAVLLERIVPQNLSEHEKKVAVEKITPHFMEHYNAHKSDHTGPYAGIIDLLKGLKNKDIPTAVATNKDKDIAVLLIEKEFGDLIHFTNGVNDEFKPKPDSSMIVDLIEKLGKDKSEILYIGDTNVDMQTAKNAGLAACGVLWGFRSKEELMAFSPAHIVSNPQEILELF